MFLKRLHIRNFRSIKDLEISFENGPEGLRQWTVILGENGVGKSTILKAIALAMTGGEALPDLLVDPSEWVRKGTKEARILVEILDHDGEPREVGLTFSADDNRRSMLSRNNKIFDQFEAEQRKASHKYLTVGYGVSRRLSVAESRSFQKSDHSIHPRAQAVITLFDTNANLYPLDTWAMDTDYRKGKEGQDLIKTTFQSLLQGVEFVEIDRKNRELLFRTPDGILPLKNLSDGFQNVAAWWGDLLFRVTEALDNHNLSITGSRDITN